MRTRARKVGQRVRPQRREDVDHLRHDRRRRHHLGQGRGRRRQGPRIPGGDRPSRLQGRRHSRQVVAARLGHFGPVAAGRAHSGIEPVARDRRLEVSADVPESGALRHRMGSDRSGHGLLRLRAAVLTAPQTIPRSAHRLASTGAGKARLDDQRDHQGAAAGSASGSSQRRR